MSQMSQGVTRCHRMSQDVTNSPTTQGCRLHGVEDSVAEPGQSSPPLAGVGLLQLRVRCFVPPLQLAEHVVKLPHELQPPSDREKTDSVRFYSDAYQGFGQA